MVAHRQQGSCLSRVFFPWCWHSLPPGQSKKTCGCSDLPTLRQAASGFAAKCGTAWFARTSRAILSYVPTSLALTLRIEGRTPPVSLGRTGIAARAVARPLSARQPEDTAHHAVPRGPRPDCRTARRRAWDPARTGTAGPAGRCAVALGQFLVDTINRHDLVTEITKVFADRGYMFAARGASMISEAPLPAANNRLVPTDIAYLSFIAELSPETQRRTPWPTQFHRSTC